MRRHVSCSTGPCLPAEVGSGAATCPVALDLASLIGRAPAQPRVPWLWTRLPARLGSGASRVLQLWILPPCKRGLRCTTCHTAPDPVSLQGRALERHVYRGSGSRLLARERSGAPCVLQLRILPPCRGGLWSAACPTAPDPASMQGRAPERCVSYSSGSCLPVEDSRAPRVLRLRILPPYREGSGAVTACPTVSCGLRTLSIKKSLVGLLV
jgi:hypothetical protein